MKKHYIIFSILSIWGSSLFLFQNSAAFELPSSLFSIAQIIIGQTTINEIKNSYGSTQSYRISADEESDIEVCYSQTESNKKSFVYFRTGVMGGDSIITGFRISSLPSTKKCLPIKSKINPLITGNGVYIGQSKNDFLKTFPFKFRQNKTELFFNTLMQRKATKDELKKLRARWPDETQDYFDVTININARFKNDLLVDYYIQKFESF
jgi:hypothetical protein